MTQGGYPPGCSQADHDRYFDGDDVAEVDEDAAYEEYRDSSEWYEDREDHLEVEPVDDGEDEQKEAA
jgi:hypothetical protein